MKLNKKNILIICICTLLGFAGGYMMNHQTDDSSEAVAIVEIPSAVPDIAPNFVTITLIDIESKLVEIKEIVSYSSEYTVTKDGAGVRKLFEKINIPLTDNNVTMKGSGIVKVFYDINQFEIEIDNRNKKIYITLPEKQISNTIDIESLEVSEKNNVFNPLKFEQYKEVLISLEEEGLKDAKSKGLLKKADENIKLIISSFLESNFEYKVIYK